MACGNGCGKEQVGRRKKEKKSLRERGGWLAGLSRRVGGAGRSDGGRSSCGCPTVAVPRCDRRQGPGRCSLHILPLFQRARSSPNIRPIDRPGDWRSAPRVEHSSKRGLTPATARGAAGADDRRTLARPVSLSLASDGPRQLGPALLRGEHMPLCPCLRHARQATDGGRSQAAGRCCLPTGGMTGVESSAAARQRLVRHAPHIFVPSARSSAPPASTEGADGPGEACRTGGHAADPSEAACAPSVMI